MPIYEYRCADCGTLFEKLRPMSKADAPADCACCGSLETSLAISLFSAITTGNGGERHAVRGTGGGCGSCGSGNCGSCSH